MQRFRASVKDVRKANTKMPVDFAAEFGCRAPTRTGRVAVQVGAARC